MSHPDLFDIIEADPPWTYQVWSDKSKRTAARHYDLMTNADIMALPVKELAKKDAYLFLWVTAPLLPIGIQTGIAWGFDFVTIGFNWVKRNRSNSWFMGNGYFTRANTELCLLFKKGKPPRPVNMGVKQIITEGNITPDEVMGETLFPMQLITQRMAHSVKPESCYQAIESMWPAANRIRLFARDRRHGWQSLGNELSGLDIRVEIARTVAAYKPRPEFSFATRPNRASIPAQIVVSVSAVGDKMNEDTAVCSASNKSQRPNVFGFASPSTSGHSLKGDPNMDNSTLFQSICPPENQSPMGGAL